MNQRYIDAITASLGMHANGTALDLIDLKTVLESLCGEGEEVDIKKANLVMDIYILDTLANRPQLICQPTFVVSDAAIATANAAAATNDVDEILDACTAGNLEFIFLGRARTLRPTSGVGPTPSNTDVVLSKLTTTVDFTAPLRKAAKRLIRSAVLATNPELAIVIACHGSASTFSVIGGLEIDYVTRPKTARMI